MLIVLLKIDLTKEDIPGAEDTVGAALLFANTIPTASSLVLSLLSHGLDARDAIKTWKGDEDDGDKKDKKGKKGKTGKKGKQEVGCTKLPPPSLLVVKPSSLSRRNADQLCVGLNKGG